MRACDARKSHPPQTTTDYAAPSSHRCQQECGTKPDALTWIRWLKEYAPSLHKWARCLGENVKAYLRILPAQRLTRIHSVAHSLMVRARDRAIRLSARKIALPKSALSLAAPTTSMKMPASDRLTALGHIQLKLGQKAPRGA